MVRVAFVVAVAVLTCAGAAAAISKTTSDFAGPFPYRAWANYWCPTDNASACEPTQYSIGVSNRTQTGGGCVTDGCRPWSMGAFPRYLDASGKRAINGGIPQRGNLTMHLEKLRDDLPGWIPDPDWEMHAVFDFEAWTPIWEHNDGSSAGWHGIIYQLESIAYVKEQFPNMTNVTEIAAIAKQQFETAALAFFVESLKAARAIRPKALWGYYGFPYGVWGECATSNWTECGYDNPVVGPAWRAANDRLAAVWANSGALYPSIYISPQGWTPYATWETYQRAHARGTVQEAARLSIAAAAAAAHNSNSSSALPAPVLPFYWPLYHNGTTAVDRADLWQLIQYAYLPPLSTQLIIWDGGPPMGSVTPDIMRTIDGPVFEAATAAAAACSESHCSGHGWCHATAAFAAPPAGSREAVGDGCAACFPGWSGDRCQTRV